MCGIAGIFNVKLDRYNKLTSHLQTMNEIQAHRGPDAEGIWRTCPIPLKKISE